MLIGVRCFLPKWGEELPEHVTEPEARLTKLCPHSEPGIGHVFLDFNGDALYSPFEDDGSLSVLVASSDLYGSLLHK